MNMNKYDRILRTYGINAVEKIQSSTVYIIGLKKGYAGEICKNLALSGINTIYLVGDEIIDTTDIKCWCYNNKLGNKCSTVLSEYIKELNSMVNVKIIANIETMIPGSCTVVINHSINDTIIINKMCRYYQSKMVYLMSSGLAGSVFVDCIEHTVMDTTGEIKDTVLIKDIVGNTIHCMEHNLMVGDIVKINMVGGDEYFNNKFRVIDTNKFNFKIVENTSNTFTLPENFTFVNGTINHINIPTTFYHNELTENNDTIVANLNNIIMGNFDNLDTKYLYTKDLICEPVTSIMSGIASSEIIKMITMKYTPLNQWFTWSDHNVFSNYDSSEQINNDYNTIIEELSKQNILLVGCGALGCEWLKNLAMLNNGTSIDIVDYDHIENSNLTRQLLFRSKDVGKSKCKTAADVIQKVNPTMKINYYENKISHEDIAFSNMIFKDKTIVINALDNITARRYVDSICFDRSLPLFESGTMGTKGNTMPIIPFLTETYSNTNDIEDTKQFPICTIKNFPNQIQHTIHWARDYFERYNRGPANCNMYSDNISFLDTLSAIDRNQAIDDINYFLDKIPQNWIDCVDKSCDLFEKLFNHDIIQLLHCFPKDHMIDGKLFWSQGKVCPSPIDFSSNYALDFIHSNTNILCYIYQLKDNFTREDIYSIIKNKKINKFDPADIKIASNDKEMLEHNTNTQDKILSYKLNTNKLNPVVFEKDDDTNYHIACINSMSNCRATNYNILSISDYDAKGIAGNIIPAIATTTSTIVGLIAIELLKYINTIKDSDNIEQYRSWFINMADNTMIYSEPVTTPYFTIGKTKLNGWTKFKHNENTTLDIFIKKYEKIFETKIEMILYNSNIIYSDFIETDINCDLYNIFKEKFNIDIKTDMVTIMLISEDTMMDIPSIQIMINN